jgi:integrase
MPKLTKRFVDAVRSAPSKGNAVYWDDDLAGFGLRAKPSGALSYCVQYRNAQSRSCRITVGRAGVLTPEEARTEARKKLAAVAQGRDPQAERTERRNDPTVAELCDLYLAEGPASKPRKKASSWEADRSNIRRHIVPLIGRKHLQTLTRADVERFQLDVTQGKSAADIKTGLRGRAIVEGGPGIAARATAVLGAILTFAVSRGLRADNPARGVERNKLPKRERFLSQEELAKLGDALTKAERSGMNRDMVAAIRLLLLTGARKSEILGLRWDWVDFERTCLRLPDSKTGAKVIPLGAPALKIIADIPRAKGKNWVFPATKGEGHLVGLPSVWQKIVEAAGLKGARLHDLRHGFASVAVADGSSLYLVGKVLGHTQARTTEKYAHVANDPELAVADRTARKIAAAMKGAIGRAQVVRLRGRL